MSDEPGRIGSRLFDACVATLLAAMALYGAIEIISAIWRPLCLILAVAAFIAVIVWIINGRMRRW